MERKLAVDIVKGLIKNIEDDKKLLNEINDVEGVEDIIYTIEDIMENTQIEIEHYMRKYNIKSWEVNGR